MDKNIKTPQTLFETLDRQTCATITDLSEKLKRLQTDVMTKLDRLTEAKDISSIEKKKQLLNLADELESIQQDIHQVITMPITDKQSPQDFLKNHRQELDAFIEMLMTNAEMINKISH